MAIRRLRLAHPELGPKPLLAKLRAQQPNLAAGNKEVREALAVLKAESKAPEAAAAPATEVKRDWTKNADAALSAAEESKPQPAVGVIRCERTCVAAKRIDESERDDGAWSWWPYNLIVVWSLLTPQQWSFLTPPRHSPGAPPQRFGVEGA